MEQTRFVWLVAGLLCLGMSVFAAEVTGTGTLTAQGNGQAHLNMQRGSATINGTGNLYINSGARVEINGIPGDVSEVKNPQGTVKGHEYTGFMGQAVVSGDPLDVTVTGININISATGIGNAYLVGDGGYQVVRDSDGATVTASNWSVSPPKELAAEWKTVAVPFGTSPTAVAENTTPDSLTAQGNGTVRVDITSGAITIAGSGDLFVSSHAHVDMTGTQGTLSTQIDRANVVEGYCYHGFHGQAVIGGDHFNVRLEGKEVHLTAHGVGNAWLIGEGSYVLANEQGSASHATASWIAPPAKGLQLDMKRIAVRFGHHEYKKIEK